MRSARIFISCSTPITRGQVLNFRRLVDTQLKHKDGNLLLPQTPGLGFDFDEKAVKKYALEKAKPWTAIK
jgi:L-alanine-DL-glutamate epimerase-like enolase superfamily enzyme